MYYRRIARITDYGFSAMRLPSSLVRLIDLLISPLVFVSGLLLKNVRRVGVASMPASKRALLAAGVFPIRDHYYEPAFNPARIHLNPNSQRHLSGIAWNLDQQLSHVRKLAPFAHEFPYGEGLANNSNFGTGDAEFWFEIIRYFKPQRIIEIGSGYSTKIARAALALNEREGHKANHTCIEPYEMPWLEESGATVIRARVEDVSAKPSPRSRRMTSYLLTPHMSFVPAAML